MINQANVCAEIVGYTADHRFRQLAQIVGPRTVPQGPPVPLQGRGGGEDGGGSPWPSSASGRRPQGSCHFFFLQNLTKFGSFSAVSALIFASKYAFFNNFHNLQDYLAEFFEIRQILQILQHLQTFC